MRPRVYYTHFVFLIYLVRNSDSDSSDNPQFLQVMEIRDEVRTGIHYEYHHQSLFVKVKQSRYRPGVAQRVPGS